nr:42 kda protein tyrosine kinase {N-terminal} [boars, semen, Peptide Partial, 18 aa] [Suidae]
SFCLTQESAKIVGSPNFP